MDNQLPHDPSVLAMLKRFREDHPYYCLTALKISDKSGDFAPFTLNKAQQYLHRRLEDQKARTGRVRAIILKGRQQGMSTYVSSRFYALANWHSNRGVFILSHHSKTTDALFRMVDRFHGSVPKQLQLGTPTHNLRQLEFENGSRYEVGTAKTGEVGRGFTIQYFHGSEVAFYENTDELKTGVLQAISDVDGTEIILESTANGVGNMFHQMCMDALEGKSDYEMIFIPWFWQEEYRVPVQEDFTLNDDEVGLKDTYHLDDEQLAWRRRKITNLGSLSLFMQEYPCTPHEAFQASGERLLDSAAVAAARTNTKTDPNAAIVLGVDPARKGDRTALVFRQGKHLLKYNVYKEMDEMTLSGIIADILRKNEVDHVFIDFGYGYGTVDRLKELGFGSRVTGVSAAGQSIHPESFANKRAEMAGSVAAWFAEGEANIPNDYELEVDLMAVPDYKPRSDGKKVLYSKEDIKKIYGKSPDLFDALALTFAFPVRRPSMMDAGQVRSATANRISGGLKTARRISDIMKQKY